MFCGSEKIPGKFLPNFPLNFPQISLRKIKKKFTNELLQERRENRRCPKSLRKKNLCSISVPYLRAVSGRFMICPGSCQAFPSYDLQRYVSGTKKHQGQIAAQGILHLRNPNLGPNSAKRILDARISDPNSWVEFFGPIFPGKKSPEKFTVEKFTSQNSPSKIQPRHRAEKFTLHLCRATWLKKQPKHKVFGRDIPGTSGTQTSGYPGQKNFMQVAFFCCFRQGVAGMSRDLGRDVPDLERLYARKLWADFSYPNVSDLFPRVLFALLPLLLATSLPPLFLGTFSPPAALRRVLCSVERRAQHTAWRGWTSPKSSGRKFLPRSA